jgi:L-galactose dehydrogenase/L-glyceraldehyde 3-phosphate reductase
MEKRVLGRTGLEVSVLGFGCGSVGGLMVRGERTDQEQAVARAVELGINYFDTAAMHGDGMSETNLGRVLSILRPDVLVASKTKVEPSKPGSVGKQIAESAKASLLRLQRDHIDVFQLHTPVTLAGTDGSITVETALEEVVPAFEALRAAGNIRFYGFSGTGEAAMLPQLIDSGAFDVAQLIYSLLNSSAGGPTLKSVGSNFDAALLRAQKAGMGCVAIRVLAGGALSGSPGRHPVGSPAPAPMGSSADYESDVTLAQRLLPLVTEGHVATLAEAALRFAISHPAVSTALIGFSDLQQVEEAAAAAEKGPLPPTAIDAIRGT